MLLKIAYSLERWPEKSMNQRCICWGWLLERNPECHKTHCDPVVTRISFPQIKTHLGALWNTPDLYAPGSRPLISTYGRDMAWDEDPLGREKQPGPA